jgi:RNA polymerase sigma-70 factor (ECF subfamily)
MAIESIETRLQAGDQADVAWVPADPAAFGQLFDEHLPKIYAFVARRVEERSAAEELTAATFERALGAAQRGDLRSDLIGDFLYRVAANAVVDRARRMRRFIPGNVRASDFDECDDRLDAEAISDAAAARGFAAAVDRNTLRRALLGLPEIDRRALLLNYFDGLDEEAMSAALGCNRSAVALKLHHALRTLGAAMRQEAADAD